jgi:hypothetical protein
MEITAPPDNQSESEIAFLQVDVAWPHHYTRTGVPVRDRWLAEEYEITVRQGHQVVAQRWHSKGHRPLGFVELTAAEASLITDPGELTVGVNVRYREPMGAGG